jgi:hypothetical protein
VKLLPSLVAVALATLVHHVHNAQFLDEYPNLPTGLSPALVYVAWLAATAVGVCGYVLVRRGWRLAGCIVLLAYAAYGLDGLLHYTLAPFFAHTLAMNATILLEAAAAALLLAVLFRQAVAR